jgi:citrate lyase beta subunit
MADANLTTSLSQHTLERLTAPLAAGNRAFAERYPGEPIGRQPVHTVYGGAQLFAFDSAQKIGALARRALDEYAPDFVTLARVLRLPGAEALPEEPEAIAALEARLTREPQASKERHRAAWLAFTIHRRVIEKLTREPVEDFRLDFEDGYGARPDAEEDGHAVSGALQIAEGLARGTLPPFIGFRIKPLTEELRARALRTLDLFVTALVKATKGALPAHFVVTLPKVQHAGQVQALAGALEALEGSLGLARGALKLELMVELTQTLVSPDGVVLLPGLVAAAGGRCVAAHFGSYDYTASCNITAQDQSMRHPACDFARHVMQVSLARTGVFLSDGATNVMPIGPHRARAGAAPLTEAQRLENRQVVHAAWQLSNTHVRDSLYRGFFQGWDLHPAQLPIRYATLYAYFFEALEATAERLANFVDKAARATLVGDVFDDAATGQGLLNFFLRGINCGALSEAETVQLTGLTLEELQERSFVTIVARRTRSQP